MSRKASLLFVFALALIAACGQPASEQSAEPAQADALQEESAQSESEQAASVLPESDPANTIQEEPVPTEPAQVEPTQAQTGVTNFYEITTPQGRMVVRLFDETPGHRDNFRKLVGEGVLDSTLFHRVMNQFMIQGGDPNSKDDDPYNDGLGGPGYQISAELDSKFFHKRGALAAARQPDQVNPERESSGSQFYIVHGRIWTEEDLVQIEQQSRQRDPSFTIPPEQRAVYTSLGGAPHLDGAYTIFGELVEGLDVLNAIATTQTTGRNGQPANRPLADVPMTVRPLFNYAL